MVTVRKRVVGLFFCFVLLFGILTFRLLYLEVIRNDYFTTLALEQRLRNSILANRGDILDRNMNKLAVSMSADAVYAIPAEITDMEQTASVLAAMLDLDAEWVKERLGRKQSMVWLKLKIDPDTAREVLQANLKASASPIGLSVSIPTVR